MKIIILILLALNLITISPDIVDMSEVVDYSATETGLLLEFEDGTGYYIEKTN